MDFFFETTFKNWCLLNLTQSFALNEKKWA